MSSSRITDGPDPFARRVQAAIPEALPYLPADPLTAYALARELVERVLAAADHAGRDGRRWTLIGDEQGHVGTGSLPDLLASGPVLAVGERVEVMPVSDHEAELVRLRAVEEAAREVVSLPVNWAGYEWRRRRRNALRSALSEPAAEKSGE